MVKIAFLPERFNWCNPANLKRIQISTTFSFSENEVEIKQITSLKNNALVQRKLKFYWPT